MECCSTPWYARRLTAVSMSIRLKISRHGNIRRPRRFAHPGAHRRCPATCRRAVSSSTATTPASPACSFAPGTRTPRPLPVGPMTAWRYPSPRIKQSRQSVHATQAADGPPFWRGLSNSGRPIESVDHGQGCRNGDSVPLPGSSPLPELMMNRIVPVERPHLCTPSVLSTELRRQSSLELVNDVLSLPAGSVDQAARVCSVLFMTPWRRRKESPSHCETWPRT